MSQAETPVRPTFPKGGSFLLHDHALDSIFVPEAFSPEDRAMAASIDAFMDAEVVPRVKQLALGHNEDMLDLLKKAGELGFLGAEVPEAYGGMAVRKTTACLLSEVACKDGGFAVSTGAHCGIGTMPITYFGNAAQKEKYLPRLATGELMAAYALTETSSGSDALNARTRAVLSADGSHYILDGSKMWITNAGFADVFIVFAKINGEQFSAFIVERDTPGFSVGAEEKKMGIKSSSTRLITLEGVKVPVENLLGQPGDGPQIAFNILNIGRLKLGPGSLGTSKLALGEATRYALERRAFGQTISAFRLMQHKLAEMTIQTFASESMSYRTAGYVDHLLESVVPGSEEEGAQSLQAIREYSIECCLVKVFASEVLAYVADEAVQIHGGYGFSQEYAVERYYRDARINRIFEGTNEINRLLAVDMFLKKAKKGELPVMAAVQGLMQSLMMGGGEAAPQPEGLLGEEQLLAANTKKVALMLLGLAFQKHGDRMAQEQELVAMAADLLIAAYTMESMVLRTLKVARDHEEHDAALMADMTRVFIADNVDKVAHWGKTALANLADATTRPMMLKILRNLLRQEPVDTIELRRRIAQATLAKKGYPI